MIILCPFDGLPLTTTAKTACCSAGHSFDWAKEGYLNLLPVQDKQSRDPGDSALMVQARRRFLSEDYFQPISSAINRLCLSRALDRTSFTALDAGCGEGYYLRALSDCLSVNHAVQKPDLCGLDISKHAVKAAAKASPAIQWVVASNRHIPYAHECFDVVVCAFGFPVWSEFKRVLKPNGLLVMVDPDSDHLIELRALLYQDVKLKQPKQVLPDGYILHDTLTVRDSFTPRTADHLRDLIAMTPHQHRVPQSVIDQLGQQPLPNLTLAVKLSLYQPESS